MQTPTATTSHAILSAQFIVTVLCLAAAYSLYRLHEPTGADLFLGLACPSPAAALNGKRAAGDVAPV